MSYIRDLYEQYVGNKKIEFTECGSESTPDCYLMSFKVRATTITLAIDFRDAPRVCPCVRVISPVFEFDGIYPVRPSGLVVVEGVTPLTWGQGDVVKLLYDALSTDIPVIKRGGSYPRTNIINKDKSMLYTQLGSQFDLHEVELIVDDSLKGNEISCDSDDEYVIVVSSLGLKTVCNNVGRMSKANGASDEFRVSRVVFANLLSDKFAEYASILLESASELRLRPIDGNVPTLESTSGLTDYEAVASGDTIELNGSRFVVETTSPSDTVKLISNVSSNERVKIMYV